MLWRLCVFRLEIGAIALQDDSHARQHQTVQS